MEKIYGAISAIMKEVGAISKSKKNQQQGFMYRGIDDVMNALQPALINHGVFVTPEILEQTREERTSKQGGNLIYSVCKIKYTFYADDGSSVSATTIGEGMDSGDKATNKAMAIALKYAFFQVFCIPTEEMKDPDSEVHEVTSKKTAHTPKQDFATLDNDDDAPDFVKEEEAKLAAELMTETQKTALLEMAKRKGITNKELLEFNSVKSSTEMTKGQFLETHEWLNKMSDKAS